ncbi:MAG: Hpt domain-containing protein, partial [Archangium sp.]|nr:Hpt domain-containing protein [Archangium sp.]
MTKDPFKYFRIEARELSDGLSRGVLELEKGGGTEHVRQLLRVAHTLKGAARVVKQAGIAGLAHDIEALLAPYRDDPRLTPTKETIDGLLKRVDEVGVLVSALALPTRQGVGAQPSVDGASDQLESVRVAMSSMDALLDQVAETGVRFAAVHRSLAEVARGQRLAVALADQLAQRRGPEEMRMRSIAQELQGVLAAAERTLRADAEQAERELGQVREQAAQLRLMPASTVFASLERAVRDAGQALGREVTLITAGGEHRLDAAVLGALRDALLHVVRNAVAHGIEPAPERVRGGKAHAGQIQISVERRGNRIAFVCRDDGRGIDTDAVRRAAVARGLLSGAQAQALGRDE